MTKINSYNDLLLEKYALEDKLSATTASIKVKIEDLKKQLKPVEAAIDTIGKFTHKDTSNPLANFGIGMGVNLLLKNVLLRNAGWVTKLVMPVLVRNFLTHEVNRPKNIFDKISDFVKEKIAGNKKDDK